MCLIQMICYQMKGLIRRLLYCVICGHVNKESIQNDQQYFLISDNVMWIHKSILFVKAHQKKTPELSSFMY